MPKGRKETFYTDRDPVDRSVTLIRRGSEYDKARLASEGRLATVPTKRKVLTSRQAGDVTQGTASTMAGIKAIARAKRDKYAK